ncbi:UNVERIFIED_CONTAM: hypothetical protein K2H54_009930 [Gekko kuhli]
MTPRVNFLYTALLGTWATSPAPVFLPPLFLPRPLLRPKSVSCHIYFSHTPTAIVHPQTSKFQVLSFLKKQKHTLPPHSTHFSFPTVLSASPTPPSKNTRGFHRPPTQQQIKVALDWYNEMGSGGRNAPKELSGEPAGRQVLPTLQFLSPRLVAATEAQSRLRGRKRGGVGRSYTKSRPAS